MVRHYECECLICRAKSTLIFHEEPFPEVGQEFLYHCPSCGKETYYTRSMNKKAIAELHRKQQEEDMKRSIILKCDEYGFQYRFLYQSVIITTALADWCFDYHQSKKTLYHESVFKLNRATGDYVKSHCQFRNKKMTVPEVIDYIATHEDWRAKNPIGGKK